MKIPKYEPFLNKKTPRRKKPRIVYAKPRLRYCLKETDKSNVTNRPKQEYQRNKRNFG